MNTIVLNRTSSVSGTIKTISVVATLASTVSVSVSNWTVSGTTISFNVTVAAGSYSIQILSTFGFYLITDILNVNAPTITAGPSQIVSYYGGQYTITGASLSPASYILVNNFRGDIISYSASAVTYNVPALSTINSDAILNLVDVSQINLGEVTFFSDQNSTVSNVTAAFDGLINTIYGSPNAQCWIGIDIGSGLYASINRIRFFPYLMWANTANYTLAATF